MTFKKTIYFIIIFLGINLFFLISPQKPALADCAGGISRTIITLDNNNNPGTTWGVYAKFTAHGTNANRYSTSYKEYTGSTPAIEICGYIGKPNRDYTEWRTSCVDPTTNYLPDVCALFGSTLVCAQSIDVSCHSGQTNTIKYRGCGQPNNHGFVHWNAVCPANRSNDCIKAGYVDRCSDGKSVCNSNCVRTTYNCDYRYSGSAMCRISSDNNNRTCVNNGSCDCTKNTDCNNNKTCVSNDCVNRYSCQSNGQCVKKVGGDYASSDCNNKCGPLDECQNDNDCDNVRVCGTGDNACKRYGTTCEFKGTGIQRHKECVRNPNDLRNLNAAVCGSGCPVGPVNLSSSASCDSSGKAAITFEWSHIPYEDNYTLFYKRHSSANFIRKGGIEPKASGPNSYTVEGLAFNTQYDWYVVGHTTDGHDDPTVKSVTAHRTTGAQTACLGNLTINTFVDYDGNGAQDSTDVVAKNIDYDISTDADPTYKSGDTGAAGSTKLTRLPSNDYTITISGVPTGWTLTTNNPQTKHVVPPTNQVANFGMQPPAPTCTGGLTANPTLVHPGVASQDTSRLTAVGCRTVDNRVPDYKWPTPDNGTTIDVNQPTTTWSIEASYNALNTFAHPTVSVCNPGSNVCKSYEAQIEIVPYFTISGNVFIDENKDGYKNNADANYNSGQTRIYLYSGSSLPDESTTPLKTITNNAGTFNFTGLIAGNYTVAYSSKPPSYSMTYPKVDGTPNLSVRLGTGQCLTNDGRTPSNSSWKTQCNAGNITNMNFGINNNVPWIQTGGSDAWFNDGFTNPIPPGATCTEPDGTAHGAFASIRLRNTGTPGVIYSGNAAPDFGGGQASVNPYNWQVGDIPGVGRYPESYTPSNGIIKTSYNYLLAAATKNGLTIRDITSYCGGNLNDCDLPNTAAALPNGIYRAEGDLHITANTTFPAGKNYVILVHGNLYVENEIHVPIGSTVIFSAGPRSSGSGGNIIINRSVGINQANVYDSFQVEGWYSADRNFTLDGENNCPTKDYRLNLQGSIVVNAGLNGGSFINNRDRCADDVNCPVFYIEERPDFTLNAPSFIQVAPRIWREVAP